MAHSWIESSLGCRRRATTPGARCTCTHHRGRLCFTNTQIYCANPMLPLSLQCRFPEGLRIVKAIRSWKGCPASSPWLRAWATSIGRLSAWIQPPICTSPLPNIATTSVGDRWRAAWAGCPPMRRVAHTKKCPGAARLHGRAQKARCARDFEERRPSRGWPNGHNGGGACSTS